MIRAILVDDEELARHAAHERGGQEHHHDGGGRCEHGEADRRAFIERFTPGGQGVGFAVLGGSFGEGIDLPGDRLVGAFVATLGLPQVNPVNERMKQRLQAAFGAGFDYAYLYPGLRKVVQAAGRVIRTPEDRGIVYLIDDRFCRAEVRALMPAWWRPAAWPLMHPRSWRAQASTAARWRSTWAPPTAGCVWH